MSNSESVVPVVLSCVRLLSLLDVEPDASNVFNSLNDCSALLNCALLLLLF